MHMNHIYIELVCHYMVDNGYCVLRFKLLPGKTDT